MGVGVMGSNIELYIEQFGWHHHHQPWKLVKKSTLLCTVEDFPNTPTPWLMLLLVLALLGKSCGKEKQVK